MDRPISPTAKPTNPRLLGLDQARAVAIMAMMVFHFAPGVFAQLPKLKTIQEPVLWFGRAATPMFVTVFGITSGFVFLTKFLRGEGVETSHRLRKRAVLILFCTILITIPHWIRLGSAGEPFSWRWVFALYSVLLFYALALALLPLWLTALRRQTLFRCALGGVLLWTAGTIGYRLWPSGELSLGEFVRMMFISGDYAYLQMMGTTLLAIPFGLRLRQVRDSGSDTGYLLTMLIGGIGLSACGALWGMSVGEYDVARIISDKGDLKVPARPWYFLHFGSFALIALAGLEFISRGVRILRGPLYVLALFGQVSLVLFTGHLFVLPFLEVLDRFTPLKGIARVMTAFLPFVIFCVVVIYRQHRKMIARSAA